jgi:DNA-binding transcriptional MerR regulator
LWTIGELAEEFGVTTRTIRFYEAKQLITPARKGVARFYTRRDRARLTLILRSKNLGFTLDEVSEYLALYDADPTHVTQQRHLLTKLDSQILTLQAKRADLDRTLRELKSIRAQTVEFLRANDEPKGE